MDFNSVITLVADVLLSTGTKIDINNYDGLIVKKLEATNTLDEGRSSNQTHIAFTSSQMDIFPYICADGYFNEVSSDTDLKKYFIAQIPMTIYESNCRYLSDELTRELTFNNGTIEAKTSVVRSRRKAQADQIQVSLINFDSAEFIAFRKAIHSGSYLVILKHYKKLKYDAFGIIPNKNIDGDAGLQELNNKFYKLSTNTVVDASTLSDNEELGRHYQGDICGENVILYGVPGCGKSRTIKDEYCNDKRYMERVVFHPDYTYSDFIGQILPVINKVDGEEKISYKFTAGPFTKILKDAVDDKEGKMHYLVIEEINRGNAPAIFGEVFQLLDRENGESEYGITNFDIADYVYGTKEHEIKIPANLTILATMNTADQNVFTLDTAFKRRWVMRSIKNDIAACEHADECIAGTNVTWYSFAKKINDTIIDVSDGNLSSEDNRLGAYFVKSEDLKSRKVFGEKVLMYLWNDAFKYDRDNVFNSEYKTLEDLLDAFAAYGFAVFNSALEFDTVVTETAEGSSKYEGDPQEYLSTKKPEFVAIYETLVELLESKISTTIDKYTTRTNDHISLRTQGKVLAEVHIQKAKIKILTRVPSNTEYLIGTKVPDTHNWTLNYSIDFSDDSNIETVVNAIIDSQNLA